MACFAAHLSSIPRLWARPVSAVLRVEIDLVHGLSTSRPSAERDTQGRSLPVGSSAGSSFLIHGSENSRPSCMRSPLILLPPEAADARRLRSTIQASPVPARRPADRRRDLQTVRHATACPVVPQRDACGDTPPQIWSAPLRCPAGDASLVRFGGGQAASLVCGATDQPDRKSTR